MDPDDQQARDDGAPFDGHDQGTVPADRAAGGRLLRIGLAVQESEANLCFQPPHLLP